MSLHTFQETLIQLYTDSRALRTYLADPHAFAASRELTPREQEAIAELPKDELARFQHELLEKRDFMARKILSRSGGSSVILSSFGTQGPELYVGTTRVSVRKISASVYRALLSLAEARKPIMRSSLIATCRAGGCTLGELFALVLLVTKERLDGKYVIAF